MAMILIVEDDALIREMVELEVKDLGYDTLSASAVEEALLLIQAPDRIDVLFTDIYLEDEVNGGYDLARRARQVRPTLGVIYATGNTLSEKNKAMMVEGAERLRKPYTTEDLRLSLETMLKARV